MVCPSNVFRNNLAPPATTNSSIPDSISSSAYKMMEINTKSSRDEFCTLAQNHIPNSSRKLAKIVCMLTFDLVDNICEARDILKSSREAHVALAEKFQKNHVLFYSGSAG